jgi:hypothetical protein
VRQANHLAKRLGERVVREKQDLAQRGLDINSDLFGVLCEGHILPFQLVWTEDSAVVDPDRSDTTRNPLSGPEIVAQTQIIMVAGR